MVWCYKTLRFRKGSAMKTFSLQLSAIFLALLAGSASATVRYVDLNSTNATPPYTDWSIAAANIQDAIDAAVDGDQVIVNNGIYSTGGRVANGFLTNRIVVDKAVTVQSLNGPVETIIEGYQMPGVTNGDSAVRCAYLVNGSVLDGFTLRGGAGRLLPINPSTLQDRSGAGVRCEGLSAVVSNCIITGNVCHGEGAGAYSGTFYHCILSNNVNSWVQQGGGGGGTSMSSLNYCDIIGNQSLCNGGGCYSNSLSNCNLIANSCSSLGVGGGGAYGCMLTNCLLLGNRGTDSGGAHGSILDHCTIVSNTATGNQASSGGGGANSSTLDYCVLASNQARNGGGAYNCSTVDSCIVSNNAATLSGGGIYGIVIAWAGQNNTVAGNSAGVTGGGVYLEWPGGLTNWVFSGNSSGGNGGGLFFPVTGIALNGCIFSSNSAVGSGGGAYILAGSFACSNCTFIGNSCGTDGGGAHYATLSKCVVVGNHANNNGCGIFGPQSLPLGYSSTSDCVFNSNSAALNGGGYYSLSTQPLINCTFTNNSAANGGGIYGGSLSNCFFIGNSAISNGGGIFGASPIRGCWIGSNTATFGGGGYNGSSYLNCNLWSNTATNSGGATYVTLNSSSSLTQCLLSHNSAVDSGGACYGGTISKSSFIGNLAGANGGGAYGSSLLNCLLAGNSATYGGGAYGSSINSSTLVGNLATNAGGGTYFATSSTIGSSIVYYNSAPVGPNFSGNATYNGCCITPLPASGTGSMTNDPVLIDFTGANFRLQTNSPCINAGVGNAGSSDLDGRSRVVGGRIDIGAYEFQGPGIGEFTAWLQQNGLPTDATADFIDTDGDGLNNWQEWIAGTIPTDSSSVLKMLSPANNAPGLNVSWQSVSGKNYFLQRSTDLIAQPPFSALQSNIVGQAGTTLYTDPTATNGGPYFYRVGVQ